MALDVPLDYAVFQLSPRRSRCELFVFYDGTTERLASGLVKPFVTNLKVAEEQVALAVKSIKLDVERHKNAETWFTKGTLERFVRFVSTPEVLEMVNTFDAEMSQLESARRIYSQGARDNQSTMSGDDGTGATAASDATKKELLKAIDVRLAAVKQDLTTACTHAISAGFNPQTVSELQLFADHFGAHRLSEACSKFIGLSQHRRDLFLNNQPWSCSGDNTLRSSAGSDMSLDDFSDNQPKPSTCHQPTTKDNSKSVGPTTTSPTSESDNSPAQSSGTPQLTRRLSVQERINLFESKQKESNSSPSVSTPSSATAGVTSNKPELRRLSSDVNFSSDKAVLRRWSGASDMSIDVSGERKELSDSNANTPTPSSSSSTLKAEEGAKDKDSKLPVRAKFGAQLSISSDGGGEGPTSSNSGSKVPSFRGRSSENAGLKVHRPISGGVRLRAASFGRGEDFELEMQSTPGQNQTEFKSGPAKIEQSGSIEQTASQDNVKGPSGGETKPQEDTGRDLGSLANGSDGRLDGQQSEAENEGLRSHFRAAEVKSQPLSRSKEGEADLLPPQPRWRSLEAEVEKFGRKDSEPFEKQSDRFLVRTENSGSLNPKSQGHGPVSEQVSKVRGCREEGGPGLMTNQLEFTEKSAWEDQEPFSSAPVGPVDQAQRVRQSKGNQGLNDELKMKANELEKLFAEHKLRAPGDQSTFARRTKPPETPKEQERSSISWKPAVQASFAQSTVMKMEPEPLASSTNVEKFISTPLIKTVDNQDYDVSPKHNVYSLGFSEDSRGKLYQKYMQKRDAKLREDWSSRRAEKEAKMKTMQDSLEKSSVEMKAKLAASADKRSTAHSARRGEKEMSFSVRSAMKREQPTDLFMSDGDEDQAEFLGKKLSETFLSDSSSRSAQSKRVLPNKNATSSTPRNSTVPVPRSSAKASNSGAARRKLNSDNPLAQSVPNFSDFRKENTKPSSAASRSSRPQVRNHARKKSSSEDLPLANEEKARKTPQFLRKSTANNPMGLNDSRNSDEVDDIEGNDLYNKFSKDLDSVPFPRKGNGSEQISRKAMRNGQDFDDANFEEKELMGVAKEEEDDDYVGKSADMDNSQGGLSQESDKSANSGFDNDDSFRFSQAGLTSVTELPNSMPSIFQMGSIQDSPGESPGSWNCRAHNPFSFTHEISDIDASDSPIGSPASWNFHTLGQADADASRMRKKWGVAQKPIVGGDSSHGLSRKDVTKGFKRFLKFGRKNRASEGLADWISATTSEGDDDTEDGRDPAYRPLEDLRKSRMGFSQSHQSDDGFNESDILTEQAPKSFFSLSNFRSKGSDSKPR